MFSIRIYLNIVWRVALVIAVAGLGTAGVVSGRAIILGCVALLVISHMSE